MIGGVLADLTGSYRMPFFWTAGDRPSSRWRWSGVVRARGLHAAATSGSAAARRSRGFALLTGSAGLLPLFFVLLMAQFSVRTVQPVVTLFVQELVGSPPQIATLAGIAFSITGLADLIASPFLGKRSDVIGYRRVLLICLAGATLTSAAADLRRQLLGVRGRAVRASACSSAASCPTANALIGRSVSRADRGTVYGMTASATSSATRSAR